MHACMRGDFGARPLFSWVKVWDTGSRFVELDIRSDGRDLNLGYSVTDKLFRFPYFQLYLQTVRERDAQPYSRGGAGGMRATAAAVAAITTVISLLWSV